MYEHCMLALNYIFIVKKVEMDEMNVVVVVEFIIFFGASRSVRDVRWSTFSNRMEERASWARSIEENPTKMSISYSSWAFLWLLCVARHLFKNISALCLWQ